ncbi:hypothetical protein BDFB_014341 [Asbolus verrucosus]
MLAIL